MSKDAKKQGYTVVCMAETGVDFSNKDREVKMNFGYQLCKRKKKLSHCKKRWLNNLADC